MKDRPGQFTGRLEDRRFLTGRDGLEDGLGPVPPFFMPKLWGGPEGYATLRPILITDKVRCVGDRIAILIAETREQARIAAEAVIVDYDPLPFVTDARSALAADAPQIWDDCDTGNLSSKIEMGDKAKTSQALARAEVTLKRRFKSPRVAPTQLEPRGCIGEDGAAEDRYTLHTSAQDPNGFRSVIARNVLKIAGVMYERMEIRFEPDGSLSILAGTHSHGLGHATVFCELVADCLSVYL
tara:strand:- start:675 stop:1394 length:720 start_codon:yes stop_codon:yes gene_type:complete